jgi:hypothetical protein
MQDVRDNEVMKSYQSPRQQEYSGKQSGGAQQAGFVVRDAPWSAASQADGGRINAPDTNSMSDFPEFGASASAAAPGSRWGPKH